MSFSTSNTVRLATGNFNQNAMDFDKNLKNLLRGLVAQLSTTILATIV